MDGDAPPILVLEAVKVTLDAIDFADLEAEMGGEMKFRHGRDRNTTEEERPCGSLEWLGDEPREADQTDHYLTADEMLMEMGLNILFDLDLATEVSDEDPPPEPEAIDATGLRVLTKVAMRCLRELKAEGAEIRNWSDSVSYGGLDADPDGTGDEGRLVLALTVLYRVRSDDPSELLATGVNA